MLSKCVTKAELGKIFSLLASLEAAGEISPDNIKILILYFSVPLFAAPLFTYVYTQTINSWTGKSEIQFKVSNHFSLSTLFPPGAVFIVQAGIFVIACMGFAFIYLTLKRNGNMDFSELVNEEEENDSLRDALREENTEHHQWTVIFKHLSCALILKFDIWYYFYKQFYNKIQNIPVITFVFTCLVKYSAYNRIHNERAMCDSCVKWAALIFYHHMFMNLIFGT